MLSKKGNRSPPFVFVSLFRRTKLLENKYLMKLFPIVAYENEIRKL